MNTQVVTIGPDEPASAAWTRMEQKRIRHLLVTDGGRLLGVLSERDLGGRKGGAVRRGRTVRELMTAQAASATPTTTLRQAANMMRGRLIGSLPVLEGDRIVGIVTATDVLEELGRGSSRPTVRAERRSRRVPPAGARRATARRTSAAKRGARAAKRAKRGGPSAQKSSAHKSSDRGGESATVRASVPGTRHMRATLARERARQPDSLKRAPLAKQVARAARRTSGRASAAETPAHIRSVGSLLDAADVEYVRRKLGRKLGKFAHSIERTSVRVEDVNGPRGGTDKRCAIKVVLSGLPSVHVDERHHSLQAALDGALAKAERAVRQSVQRRRMRPLRSRKTEERALVAG